MYIFKNKTTDNRLTQKYYFSNLEFKVIEVDWNHDNDIYTQKITAITEGYNYNDLVTYEELTDDYIQVNQIKFYDKISNAEVIIQDYEIQSIYKSNEGYELINNDDIVFQFDDITE